MEEKEHNPFTVPVAMLIYRVARNMKQQGSKQHGCIRMLLENCISLLDKDKHPQVSNSSLDTAYVFIIVKRERVQNCAALILVIFLSTEILKLEMIGMIIFKSLLLKLFRTLLILDHIL